MKLQDLTESSDFTKFRKYIFGLKNQGQGIAILTPQNPLGGEDSANAFNAMTQQDQNAKNRMNNQLYSDGEDYINNTLHKRFFKQKGIFDGESELSYIIIDMSYDETLKLGRQWKQTAIIWIGRDDRGYVMKFVYTGANPKYPYNVASVVRKLFGTNAKDNMSKLGSNSYVIPFFDDEYESGS